MKSEGVRKKKRTVHFPEAGEVDREMEYEKYSGGIRNSMYWWPHANVDRNRREVRNERRVSGQQQRRASMPYNVGWNAAWR